MVGFERSEAAVALGIAAGGALAVWLIVVALLAAVTRTKAPEPQPAGLELGGDEPPAVVNLLVNGWKVRGEAMSSTLVDLAARHVVGFERGADGRLLVRVNQKAADLTPYEHKILELTQRSANGSTVPLDALTLGTDAQAQSFHKSFRKAVAADARERGLSRSRWSKAMTALVGAVAVAPALLAAGALVALPDAHKSSSSSSDNPVGAFIGIALFSWIGLMALFRSLRAERDTPEGLRIAGRWLGLRENLEADGTFPSLPPTAVAIWDRYLAYAVAMGVAVTTERSIPLGAESDTEAWSSVGGRWRVVRVRYPQRVPPGWGRPPWKNAFAGLFSAGVAVAIGLFVLPALYQAQADLLKKTTAQDHRIALAVSVGIGFVGFVLAVVALRGVWMLVLGVVDLGRGRELEGRVLRVRTRNERTYVAVDDGSDDHLSAWVSTQPTHQGAEVRVTVATHVGYVRRIETIGAGVGDGTVDSLSPDASSFADGRSGAPVADLLAQLSTTEASPVALDAAWVSSLVGSPMKSVGGARLQGPHGLAIGAVMVATGAAAAFRLINTLPPADRDPVAGVADEAVKIGQIRGLAARRGDRGVLVFVRGGTLDDDRRYDAAGAIARWALTDSTSEPQRSPD